ncbi:MAG: hypothetical protein GC159_17035 [Phycisphaera sp.]|nr:hypothetical protein [Phycisphaera sp.]
MSDGLREEDDGFASDLGFEVTRIDEPRIIDALRDYPGLLKMRPNLPTWRHLIDSAVIAPEADHILLIDTDVFVVEPVAFPDNGVEFFYNGGDIPGFRGRWYLPLVRPMLPTINPGFFLYRRDAMDLALMDELVRRYFLGSKNYWWTRQAALSVIVAASPHAGIFDGNDVRVISGNKKRTPEEVRRNHWKLMGNSEPVTDRDLMERYIEDAAVIHFAGRGKDWIDLATGRSRDSGTPRFLRTYAGPRATYLQRCLIAARMLAIQTRR